MMITDALSALTIVDCNVREVTPAQREEMEVLLEGKSSFLKELKGNRLAFATQIFKALESRLRIEVIDEPDPRNYEWCERALDELHRIKIAQNSEGERVLDCSQAGLTRLPRGLFTNGPYWANLSWCYLSNMRLKVLPPSIAYLSSLQFLCLNNNQLEALPEEMGKLTALKILRLDSNHFKVFPEPVVNLTGLLGLSLAQNQLRELPEAFSRLQSVDHLRLQHNLFREVPEVIWTLTELDHLYFDNNQLAALSAKVAALGELEVLSLDNNDLPSLPDELTKLPELKRVYAAGNRLTATAIPQALNCFYLSEENDVKGRAISRQDLLQHQRPNLKAIE